MIFFDIPDKAQCCCNRKRLYVHAYMATVNQSLRYCELLAAQWMVYWSVLVRSAFWIRILIVKQLGRANQSVITLRAGYINDG